MVSYRVPKAVLAALMFSEVDSFIYNTWCNSKKMADLAIENIKDHNKLLTKHVCCDIHRFKFDTDRKGWQRPTTVNLASLFKAISTSWSFLLHEGDTVSQATEDGKKVVWIEGKHNKRRTKMILQGLNDGETITCFRSLLDQYGSAIDSFTVQEGHQGALKAKSAPVGAGAEKKGTPAKKTSSIRRDEDSEISVAEAKNPELRKVSFVSLLASVFFSPWALVLVPVCCACVLVVGFLLGKKCYSIEAQAAQTRARDIVKNWIEENDKGRKPTAYENVLAKLGLVSTDKLENYRRMNASAPKGTRI